MNGLRNLFQNQKTKHSTPSKLKTRSISVISIRFDVETHIFRFLSVLKCLWCVRVAQKLFLTCIPIHLSITCIKCVKFKVVFTSGSFTTTRYVNEWNFLVTICDREFIYLTLVHCLNRFHLFPSIAILCEHFKKKKIDTKKSLNSAWF